MNNSYWIRPEISETSYGDVLELSHNSIDFVYRLIVRVVFNEIELTQISLKYYGICA